ncbi:Amidohydrolase [anaerobic digester metagenome]
MSHHQILDVHCHLFNGVYALTELTAASWNILKGTYPQVPPQARGAPRSFLSLEGIGEFAAYAARLLEAALSDCEGNYTTQLDSLAGSALAGGELLCAPLMMDIYYALDNNGRETDSPEEARPLPVTGQPFTVQEKERADFAQHLEQVRDLVAREMIRLTQGPTGLYETRVDPIQQLDREIEALRERWLGIREAVPKDSADGMGLSPGYQDHMEALEQLARSRPGSVFPFLAIDPRRPGIQHLLELKLAEGRGIFRGVKLYPPLGYLPTHPALEPVYTYCQRYDIPITVHCSLGGFENLRRQNLVESWTAQPHWESFTKVRKTKSRYYANPQNWRPVLERFPGLRLNFAHLGGSRANSAGAINETWFDTILSLMSEYPNIYADLAYVASPKRQAQTLARIKQNDLLMQRVMFGTDFIMLAMDRELGGLVRYFTNYAGIEEDLLINNARRFLKLEDS